MKANKVIYVYFEDVLVGTLAKTSSHMVAFEYDDMWIKLNDPPKMVHCST